MLRPATFKYIVALGVGIAALGTAYGLRRSNEHADQPLLVWAWNTPAKSLRELLPEFHGAHPGTQVRIDMLGSNMSRARFLLALSAGVGAPDVAMIEIQNVQRFASTGTLSDLTALTAPLKSSFPTAFWDNCVWQGRTYAVPWDMGPSGVFYKRAVFERFGIDADEISTWDDLISAGEKIDRLSQGNTRLMPLSTGDLAPLFEILLQQAGGQVFDSRGRVALDSPATKEALGVLRRLIRSKTTANIAPYGYEVFNSVNDDTIAAYPGPVWFGGMIKDVAQPKVSGELQWAVMRLPAIKSGGLRNGNRGGSVLVIPRQSQQFEAAWQFLQFAVCRVESHLHHYQRFQLFPAFLPAHADERFAVADPFFSNQKIADVYSQQLAEIPALNRTADWLQAENYLNQALGHWVAVGMPETDFLPLLARKLARRTHREVAPPAAPPQRETS